MSSIDPFKKIYKPSWTKRRLWKPLAAASAFAASSAASTPLGSYLGMDFCMMALSGERDSPDAAETN